jgi:hypothetical protein
MRIRNLLFQRAPLRYSCLLLLLLLLSLPRASTALDDPESVAAVCPGFIAHIVLYDYDGAHATTACVAPGGLSIQQNSVTLIAYDYLSDGVFHSGFEALP